MAGSAGPFPTTTSTRHVSRFTQAAGERERVAKLAISVLSALRGSICLYQGEELALPEAELQLEDLRDPYGIRFWPAFKGRDGCRTPMVWEKATDHAGSLQRQALRCRCLPNIGRLPPISRKELAPFSIITGRHWPSERRTRRCSTAR